MANELLPEELAEMLAPQNQQARNRLAGLAFVGQALPRALKQTATEAPKRALISDLAGVLDLMGMAQQGMQFMGNRLGEQIGLPPVTRPQLSGDPVREFMGLEPGPGEALELLSVAPLLGAGVKFTGLIGRQFDKLTKDIIKLDFDINQQQSAVMGIDRAIRNVFGIDFKDMDRLAPELLARKTTHAENKFFNTIFSSPADRQELMEAVPGLSFVDGEVRIPAHRKADLDEYIEDTVRLESVGSGGPGANTLPPSFLSGGFELTSKGHDDSLLRMMALSQKQDPDEFVGRFFNAKAERVKQQGVADTMLDQRSQMLTRQVQLERSAAFQQTQIDQLNKVPAIRAVRAGSEGPLQEGFLRFRHFGNKDVDTLKTEFHGSGLLSNAEKNRQAVPSIAAYGEGNVRKEPGLGPHEFVIDIPEEKAYNLSTDPNGLKELAQVPSGSFTLDEAGKMVPMNTRTDFTKLEELVKERGFWAYHTPDAEGILRGQARIFTDILIEK